MSTSLHVQLILIRFFAFVFSLFILRALYSQYFGEGTFLDREFSDYEALMSLAVVVGVWIAAYLAGPWFKVLARLEKPRQ